VPTDVHDLAEIRRLLDGGAQLVEVLPASACQSEHLPGAVNVPLTELLADRIGELDRSRPVVAYCFDYQ
jgi:rhodanese-related sulfurtransferase